jgi:hypothetical protein
LVVAVRVRVCPAVIPGGIWGRTRVWHRKLGMVCVYPCLNMLAVVCYDIPKVGAEPSMVVWL